MNTLLISFGDAMLTGRIEWPIDGVFLALGMLAAFAVLLLVLLLESSRSTDAAIRVKPKGVRPMAGPLHYPHAA